MTPIFWPWSTSYAQSGAEAISINGQRIVARTEIRCVGPVITVNGTRIAPPIKIQAIDDPNVLRACSKNAWRSSR